jgi:hypothetical protein
MSTLVCVSTPNALGYPQGGHLWVFLNWCLGLEACGCEVSWLDVVDSDAPAETVRAQVLTLKDRLRDYGLADALVVGTRAGESHPGALAAGSLPSEAALSADLLLNFRNDLSPELVGRFRRSAFLDLDPGILQLNLAKGFVPLAPHDCYFTIGETIGQAGSLIPDAGLAWQHTPPCVCLEWWPVHPAPDDAAFTTVSHWYMNDWLVEEDGTFYLNDKRAGFLPFLELPLRTTQPLALAIHLAGDDAERDALTSKGWRIQEAHDVAATPSQYQRFVQESRGEFSCAKPSCVRLQTAWISDRTLCYLASGKPAVVEHTGPSRLLPDAEGLFRFHDAEGAVRCLERATADYEHQCALARALAEEHFDAKRVVGRLLERALA